MTRIQAAQVFLEVLEKVSWRTDGEHLYGSPSSAVTHQEREFARVLKPELVALLAFTPHQREIILRLDPAVTLAGLVRYRQGLDLWDQFPPEDQTKLQGHPWTLEDLVNLHRLRTECGGQVIEVEYDLGL